MVRKLTMKWLAAMKAKGVEPDIRTMKAAVGNNPVSGVSASLETECPEGDLDHAASDAPLQQKKQNLTPGDQQVLDKQSTSSSTAPSRVPTTGARSNPSKGPVGNLLTGTEKEWRARFLELNEDRCKAILHQLRSRGLERSVLTLSDHAALLERFASNGEARAAAMWLDEMCEAKVVPDASCSRKIGLRPGIVSYPGFNWLWISPFPVLFRFCGGTLEMV